MERDTAVEVRRRRGFKGVVYENGSDGGDTDGWTKRGPGEGRL